MSKHNHKIGSVSRVYAHALENVPRDQWDYEITQIQWGKQDPYKITRKIGRGKYSDVFEGVIEKELYPCIIKVLKPVKEEKFRREIMVLERLNGGPNIVMLYDCVMEMETKTPSLIMEYVNNTEFRKLYPQLTLQDMKYYLYQLLRALDYTHSKGIMHRDVKPQNICIDHHKKILRLIDWGLAEFYHPNQEYNVRVASRYYKAPELLVNMFTYDYSLDMWGVGCVLSAMIFMKEPLFKGSDNNDQLVKIVSVLGSDDFGVYMKKYGLKVDSRTAEKLKNKPKQSWSIFMNDVNKQFATDEALDLLDHLLVYDHQNRLTAKEAMEHKFFKDCK
ncbi:non-specific serine/threonine protein kinase [Entamoeba marina]